MREDFSRLIMTPTPAADRSLQESLERPCETWTPGLCELLHSLHVFTHHRPTNQPTMSTDNTLSLNVGFSGGAELLFGNEKQLPLNLARDDKPWTLGRLIEHLKTFHLKERPELFVTGQTVRPGILVLVNDTDWELLGELNYEIQPKDDILFISTLHGG